MSLETFDDPHSHEADDLALQAEAISAVSLWSAAKALPKAISLADEFLTGHTLSASERASLVKLAEELRTRFVQ
jgi:hypothetical protein